MGLQVSPSASLVMAAIVSCLLPVHAVVGTQCHILEGNSYNYPLSLKFEFLSHISKSSINPQSIIESLKHTNNNTTVLDNVVYANTS
jgi:hypothetical protein